MSGSQTYRVALLSNAMHQERFAQVFARHPRLRLAVVVDEPDVEPYVARRNRALAAEHGSRLQTLTLAFDEYAGTDADEAPLAEEAARVLGSEHATIRIGRDEFEALLDDFLAAMDQPTIDGLNTYLISHAAAGLGLKVVLSGLGGDELLGGYP